MKPRKLLIYGATSHIERTKILQAFKTSKDVNTIFLSKFCYSEDIWGLVWLLTGLLNLLMGACVLREMYYSTKRQQSLIDQGYSFKIITSFPPADDGPHLNCYHLDDQLAFLGKVLSDGDNAVGLEQLEDAGEIALRSARRSSASMSAMSGANGMFYMEYSTGRDKTQGQIKSKAKDKRHPLFRRRYGLQRKVHNFWEEKRCE